MQHQVDVTVSMTASNLKVKTTESTISKDKVILIHIDI